jgi:hypothetical protein
LNYLAQHIHRKREASFIPRKAFQNACRLLDTDSLVETAREVTFQKPLQTSGVLVAGSHPIRSQSDHFPRSKLPGV